MLAERWWTPPLFASVMATSAISVSARELGFTDVSDALLWIAVALFAILLSRHATRLARDRRAVVEELEGARAFDYLTLVAAGAVIGSRLLPGDGLRSQAAWGLLALSALVWLVVTTAIVCDLAVGALLARFRVRGSWLLATVAAQSLCILLLALSRRGGDAARVIATALWLFGSALYLPIAAGRVRVLAGARSLVRELGSDDWILMGAAAISTLAAAHLRDALAAAHTAHGAVGVVMIVEFAVACAAIVGLAGAEVARLRIGDPGYLEERWSTLFPLGMFSLACVAVAHITKSGALKGLGGAFLALAGALWLLLATRLCVLFLRDVLHHRRRDARSEVM